MERGLGFTVGGVPPWRDLPTATVGQPFRLCQRAALKPPEVSRTRCKVEDVMKSSLAGTLVLLSLVCGCPEKDQAGPADAEASREAETVEDARYGPGHERTLGICGCPKGFLRSGGRI